MEIDAQRLFPDRHAHTVTFRLNHEEFDLYKAVTAYINEFLPQDGSHRFGFHNLRHSLAPFLVRTKTDPKTVQTLLRHSNVKTTLQLYAHSVSEDRLAAQGQALAAFLQPPASSVVH